MRERGDFDVVDAVTRTTGLSAQGNGGNGGLSFTARGFAGVNSVGVAEDGIRLGVAAGSVTYPSDSWGYERIEVLRGPASIVYGSGTAGAVVNAIRKQPGRERATEVLVGAGQYDSYRLGVGAAGPIGEIASYRVDAYGHSTSGERDLGRAKGGKFMGTLRLDPRSDLRFELLADVSEQKPERYWGAPTVNGRVPKRLRDENYNVRDSVIRYQDQRLRARVEWKASEWLTVRNEAHYFKADRHWKNIEAYEYDRAREMVERFDYLEITHDLEQKGNRLEAAISVGTHNAVVGWEITKAEFTGGNNSPYRGSSTVSARNPVHGFWDSPDAWANKFDSDTTQHALYAEDAWQFSDKWLLLAGVRRDVSKVDRKERVGGTPFDKTLGGTAWRLGLTHFLTPGLSVYGQVSQGHDPVTNILTLNLANRSFKLTTARQAELGVKQQFGQGLGEWTAAVYRIEKDDIITRDPDRPSISVQGGSQHSKGVELSAVLTPSPQWRLEGNVALVRAEFDKLIEGGGANRAGNRPANVPRTLANLWAHYRIGDWQASLGGRYVGNRYANNANTFTLPSYVVADAALSWQIDSNTTLRLLGRNLTDKTYVSASYGAQHLLGEGRRAELLAEFRF